jgi:segregation and condensation protein B
VSDGHTPASEARVTTLAPDALLEAFLFVAQEPVPPEALFSAAGLSEEEGQAALHALEERLEGGGLRLQRSRRRVQLVTAPAAAPHIENFLGLEVNLRLSQAALETLSIVAYAQPVTRPQIEAIRGVNSDSVLRTLLRAGLIVEQGRADSVGRPILYATTFEFLQQFGLAALDDLPPLEPPAGESPHEILEEDA